MPTFLRSTSALPFPAHALPFCPPVSRPRSAAIPSVAAEEILLLEAQSRVATGAMAQGSRLISSSTPGHASIACSEPLARHRGDTGRRCYIFTDASPSSGAARGEERVMKHQPHKGSRRHAMRSPVSFLYLPPMPCRLPLLPSSSSSSAHALPSDCT
jgi:hypothetical protein